MLFFPLHQESFTNSSTLQKEFQEQNGKKGKQRGKPFPLKGEHNKATAEKQRIRSFSLKEFQGSKSTHRDVKSKVLV